jgi:hypothetical protein
MRSCDCVTQVRDLILGAWQIPVAPRHPSTRALLAIQGAAVVLKQSIGELRHTAVPAE